MGVFFTTFAVCLLCVGLVSYGIDELRRKFVFVELRDTKGRPLGMRKKQFKRYIRALGTKDPRVIAKAYEEVRRRKEQLCRR